MRTLVVALALLVAGLSWSRVIGFHRVTGPHEVAWRDIHDKPLAKAHGHGASFVLDGRVIVSVSGNGPNEVGYAWIDPARGEAKIAWPVSEVLHPFMPAGLATHGSTFAVALLLQEGPSHAYVVGIAGPDGWLRAPSPVLTRPAPTSPAFGLPLLLGMAFRGGELELVFTHPLGEDVYGNHQAPDVMRVPTAGAPSTVSHPLRCDSCNVVGAIPDDSGWKLVAQDASFASALIVDARGDTTPAPEALAWWKGFSTQYDVDRAALGTLWGRNNPELVAAADGRREPLEPPFADFAALHVSRFELVAGVVHPQSLWSSSHDEFRTLAQRAAGRVVVTSSSRDNEEQLVGDDPGHLHAALGGTNTYAFGDGHFLPKGDGFLWVADDGAYVTLDHDLQRVDPLSIAEHLRTRGSGGTFLDEPRHVWLFGWALFGLPAVLLVSLVLARARGRTVALRGAFATYVVTGGIALALVWPLL